MPSCTRFATFAVLVGLAVYLSLVALAATVEPRQREMTTSITLPPRAADNVAVRMSTSMPSDQSASLYESLQGLPLSSR
jgi:hypothetical protein